MAKCACAALRDGHSARRSRKAAHAHFATKGIFRAFDPDCLADYVRYGTVRSPHGVRLAFDPRIEYEIYRATPHDIYAYLPRFHVPGGMVIGRDSDVVERVGLAASRRRFTIRKLDGGHLFPFERPVETARAVHELARELVARKTDKRVATDRHR